MCNINQLNENSLVGKKKLSVLVIMATTQPDFHEVRLICAGSISIFLHNMEESTR